MLQSEFQSNQMIAPVAIPNRTENSIQLFALHLISFPFMKFSRFFAIRAFSSCVLCFFSAANCPIELTSLEAGEFYGTLVDSDQAEFRGRFLESDKNPQEIEPFKVVGEEQVKENFRRFKEEARAILDGRTGEKDGEK